MRLFFWILLCLFVGHQKFKKKSHQISYNSRIKSNKIAQCSVSLSRLWQTHVSCTLNVRSIVYKYIYVCEYGKTEIESICRPSHFHAQTRAKEIVNKHLKHTHSATRFAARQRTLQTALLPLTSSHVLRFTYKYSFYYSRSPFAPKIDDDKRL